MVRISRRSCCERKSGGKRQVDAPTNASGRFQSPDHEDTMLKASQAMVILAAISIVAIPTASTATDSPQPSTCTLAVRKVQRDIFSLPQGALTAGAQRQAVVQLGTAERAAPRPRDQPKKRKIILLGDDRTLW